MALLRFKEAREMTLDKIEERLVQLRADRGKMRSQVRSGGAPENSGKMHEMRRAIARLETAKTQILKGGAAQPGKGAGKERAKEAKHEPAAKKAVKAAAKPKAKKAKA